MKKETVKISDELLLQELKKRFEDRNNSIQELEKLNKKLKEINQKLVESETMKSHFLSNMSNEIINPFSSIMGLAKIITSEKNPEKIKKNAALLYDETQNIGFQFKNIFWAAQIEAGKLEFNLQSIKLDQLIRSSIEKVNYQAQKKKISFEYQNSNIEFISDIYKLEAVFENILDNAIKFSPVNQKVKIKTYQKDENIITLFEDFGIGMKKENLEIIFDRFKKLNNEIYTENMGQGLGLAIVKELVELLYGRIEVNSQAGKGSSFFVILPQKLPIESTDNSIFDDGVELF